MSRSSSVVEYCLLVGGGTARESEVRRLAPDGVGGGLGAACGGGAIRGVPARSVAGSASAGLPAGTVALFSVRHLFCDPSRPLWFLPVAPAAGNASTALLSIFPIFLPFSTSNPHPLYCVVSFYPIYHKITPKSWSKVSNDRN